METLDLDGLGVPSGRNHNHRCKVALTTRRRDVCVAMEAQKITEIGILSEKEAWTLFRQKAGNSVDDPSLFDVAENVAKECKGLPLAIITVARALKGKTKRSWEDALDQLKRAAPTNIQGVNKDVYQHLKLSYDHVESDQGKYLFLLCSLFEEDSDISLEELLRYGMGLGIFTEITSLEGARNRVCHLLETLKDCFLLLEGSKENYVKMHDVVRDVAIYIASEDEYIFMVSHDVNSKEFPRRNSYEKYSHMSIVANKFDELPRQPICCPKLKLLMLKLSSEDPLKLQDDFFDGMSELNVLSLSGYDQDVILSFPASIQRLLNLRTLCLIDLRLDDISIQRLSNLRTLCLIDLRLDDISIIGGLKALEILSIRGSQLKELPLEIGNLSKLIILEISAVERISPEVLSKLILLEELHIMEFKYCSYSTLKELESLSRLTALTLIQCSGDVIYSNFDLPSKLTRFALKASQNDYPSFDTLLMVKYDRIMDLEVNETTPLGDWICNLLRKSECIRSIGKGSKNVLTELQLDGFQKVKYLYLDDFDSLTHSLNIQCLNNILFLNLEKLYLMDCRGLQYVFSISLAGECSTVAYPEEEEISRRTHEVIKFPNLYDLSLLRLDDLTHFCSDTVDGIEFPLLQEICFSELGEFQNFWPTANNSITDSNPLFNEKVSCPNLKELLLYEAESITALCSLQLPNSYFSKLGILSVDGCGKLRNLMSLSVARGLLNLRILRIKKCRSMEEVIITEEEEQGEVMTNDQPLFPLLKDLELEYLPKLGHFFLTKHALKFPSLSHMVIEHCPKMKTFTMGSVSTPSLKEEVDIDDLNKWIQQRFQEEKGSQGTADGDESEATEGDESEATNSGQSEATNGDESERIQQRFINPNKEIAVNLKLHSNDGRS